MKLQNIKQQLSAQGGGEEIDNNTKNIARLKIRTSVDFM